MSIYLSLYRQDVMDFKSIVTLLDLHTYLLIVQRLLIHILLLKAILQYILFTRAAATKFQRDKSLLSKFPNICEFMAACFNLDLISLKLYKYTFVYMQWRKATESRISLYSRISSLYTINLYESLFKSMAIVLRFTIYISTYLDILKPSELILLIKVILNCT